jgi:hypothetical protein
VTLIFPMRPAGLTVASHFRVDRLEPVEGLDAGRDPVGVGWAHDDAGRAQVR